MYWKFVLLILEPLHLTTTKHGLFSSSLSSSSTKNEITVTKTNLFSSCTIFKASRSYIQMTFLLIVSQRWWVIHSHVPFDWCIWEYPCYLSWDSLSKVKMKGDNGHNMFTCRNFKDKTTLSWVLFLSSEFLPLLDLCTHYLFF